MLRVATEGEDYNEAGLKHFFNAACVGLNTLLPGDSTTDKVTSRTGDSDLNEKCKEDLLKKLYGENYDQLISFYEGLPEVSAIDILTSRTGDSGLNEKFKDIRTLVAENDRTSSLPWDLPGGSATDKVTSRTGDSGVKDEKLKEIEGYLMNMMDEDDQLQICDLPGDSATDKVTSRTGDSGVKDEKLKEIEGYLMNMMDE